jgi:hypothetical protein
VLLRGAQLLHVNLPNQGTHMARDLVVLCDHGNDILQASRGNKLGPLACLTTGSRPDNQDDLANSPRETSIQAEEPLDLCGRAPQSRPS